MTFDAVVPIEQITDGTPITYGVVQPGVEDPSGVRFVRGGDVFNGRINVDGLRTISQELSAQYKRTLLRGGELLISLVGNPGEVAIAPPSLAGSNIARQVGLIRIDEARFNPWFVLYYLMSPAGKAQLFSYSLGSVQSVINLKELRRVQIPAVSRRVQDAIVEALKGIDDKIDLNHRINQTLEAMAQAIFKSWFVDFDPVKAKIAAKAEGRDPLRAAMTAISGKTDAELDTLPPDQFAPLAATAALFPDEMEDSELGEIPKGWKASTLGDLCRAFGGLIQTGPFGSQLHAHDYATEGVPVVMPQDMTGRRISSAKIARVRELDADRLRRHRMQAGDVVFSRRGDVGRHALVTPREIGWLCGTGCLLVRPSTGERISAYVSCALAQPEALEWLTRHAVGATMPNLNTTILSNLPMVLAPSALMSRFQEQVGAMEAAMNLSIAEIGTLSELRDALLPKLLSGELQVHQAEAEATA